MEPVTAGTTAYPDWQHTVSGATAFVQLVRDADGAVVLARSSAAIVERPAGYAHYIATRLVPADAVAGDHTWYWDDGTVAAGHVAAESMTVLAPAAVSGGPVFAGVDGLCSLEDAKAYLDISEDVADPDELLTRLIAAATTMIQRVSGRLFVGPAATDRWVRIPYSSTGFLIPDASAINSLGLYNSAGASPVLTAAWSSADYAAVPYDATGLGEPFTGVELYNAIGFGGGFVKVNADWGWPAVPEDIREAAIQQVALSYARNVQRFSGVINLETGRVEIPRALAASSRDIALRYKRRSVRVGL